MFFTPPSSKSSAERKACCCNWGDSCCHLTTFFSKQKDHPWNGIIQLKYSNSCDFQNFLHGAANFLRIPRSTLEEWQQQFDQHHNEKTAAATPTKPTTIVPRITISRFHFDIDLVGFIKAREIQRSAWVIPLTIEEAKTIPSYSNRGKSLCNDTLMRYNPTLGRGQSERSKKENPGTLIRIVPATTRASVEEVAATIQAGGVINTPKRLDFDAKRAVYHAKQERDKEIMHELDIESRHTEDWIGETEKNIAIIDSKDQTITELKTKLNTLKRKLEEAEGENKRLKLMHKAKQKKVEHARSDLFESLTSEDEEIIEQSVMKKINELISQVGGVSRLTMLNDEWHDKHKDAAWLLWGYNSWDETKLYVKAYFPELDTSYDPSKHIQQSKDGGFRLPNLSDFERCMITRMFFHSFSRQNIVAMFIDRDRTAIGKIIKQWAPRWANVGIDLSILDITDDYLTKEVPDKNIDLGKPHLVYVDGKDYLCAPKRSDTTIEKAQFSSKNEKTAARDLTLTTAIGCVFEQSPLFCGRGGERQIVEWMGSLGPMTAPINEWKDVAITDPWTKGDDKFWTALSDAMSAKEVEEALEEDTNALLPDGLLDDGILITGQPTGLAKEGLADVTNASDEEESDDDTAVECQNNNKNESARHIYGISDALAGYLTMVKHNIVDKVQRDIGANKRPPILSQEILKKQNESALRNDPNQSGKRKLCQMERHQRLHVLYEAGKLQKCILSYFLLETESDRLKLLRWMGSNLAGNIPMPNREDINEIALRLAKIPERYGVGADKGFTGIEKFMPNCNDADTPPGVVNSKKERISKGQIEAEIPITTVRGGSETVFKRIVNEDALREKIPYRLIQWLPHVHALAHGEANLFKPLRYPGQNSSVGADYWDNKIDYTRTSCPSTKSNYVGTSRKRMCSKCKTGGIVEICQVCKK